MTPFLVIATTRFGPHNYWLDFVFGAGGALFLTLIVWTIKRLNRAEKAVMHTIILVMMLVAGSVVVPIGRCYVAGLLFGSLPMAVILLRKRGRDANKNGIGQPSPPIS